MCEIQLSFSWHLLCVRLSRHGLLQMVSQIGKYFFLLFYQVVGHVSLHHQDLFQDLIRSLDFRRLLRNLQNFH